jgi:putative SOS response-associated peptidase YedK
MCGGCTVVELRRMLAPYDADAMEAWAVSQAGNNPHADGEPLMRAIDGGRLMEVGR